MAEIFTHNQTARPYLQVNNKKYGISRLSFTKQLNQLPVCLCVLQPKKAGIITVNGNTTEDPMQLFKQVAQQTSIPQCKVYDNGQCILDGVMTSISPTIDSNISSPNAYVQCSCTSKVGKLMYSPMRDFIMCNNQAFAKLGDQAQLQATLSTTFQGYSSLPSPTITTSNIVQLLKNVVAQLKSRSDQKQKKDTTTVSMDIDLSNVDGNLQLSKNVFQVDKGNSQQEAWVKQFINTFCTALSTMDIFSALTDTANRNCIDICPQPITGKASAGVQLIPSYIVPKATKDIWRVGTISRINILGTLIKRLKTPDLLIGRTTKAIKHQGNTDIYAADYNVVRYPQTTDTTKLQKVLAVTLPAWISAGIPADYEANQAKGVVNKLAKAWLQALYSITFKSFQQAQLTIFNDGPYGQIGQKPYKDIHLGRSVLVDLGSVNDGVNTAFNSLAQMKYLIGRVTKWHYTVVVGQNQYSSRKQETITLSQILFMSNLATKNIYTQTELKDSQLFKAINV